MKKSSGNRHQNVGRSGHIVNRESEDAKGSCMKPLALSRLTFDGSLWAFSILFR